MNADESPIEQLEVTGSHFEVGFAIGERFAMQIQRLLDNYAFFQQQIVPHHRTPDGRARYQALLESSRSRFPNYCVELEGLAQGAKCSFEDLFLVNMRGEYREHLRGTELRGCTDCALLTDEAALIGHNEDGSPILRDNMYLIHARVEDAPAFTALSYPGFLCGNAFGFNAAGVCFSIDNVSPRNVREGVGRQFVARSLLDACSLDDAIERATVPGQAMGFSYTIGSTAERRIVLVEVAPGSYHVRDVRGCYSHTNHYRELDATQTVGPSSLARLERANTLLRKDPPVDAAGVLSILGDHADEGFPIYRTAAPPDQSATLYTALFDLDRRSLRIYTGHPARDADKSVAFAM